MTTEERLEIYLGKLHIRIAVLETENEQLKAELVRANGKLKETPVEVPTS